MHISAQYFLSIFGIFLLCFGLTSSIVLFSASSPNFTITNGNTNDTFNQFTGSNNFSVSCSQVGVGSGSSSSNSFTISGNDPCTQEIISLSFIYAPEKRVPLPPPNRAQNTIRISVYPVGSTSPLYTTAVPNSTNSTGNSVNPEQVTIQPGVYDVRIKSSSHLSQKRSSVTLTAPTTLIDFSQGFTLFARSGDVNGATYGDDAVNALDIGTMVNNLTSTTYRTDLNKDGVVNALDLGMTIANLGQTGE
jgi:hypothetical protein